MRLLPDEFFRSFERLCAGAGTSVDDRRKRSYVAFSLVLLIPVAVTFGVDDLRQGNRVEGAVVLAVAVFLAGVLVALTRVRDLLPLLRLGLCLTLLLQSYELRIGGGGGLAFLWFYFIPVVVLAFFGEREGTAWALAILAAAALAFLVPGGHAYESENVWRFLITYALVFIFSYGLESSRRRLHSRLVAEKASLEEALAEVKTLRGLLPICTRCKKVRDDQGYWQQIEPFVDRRSEARFSHGLCPKCVTRLYPGLLDE